MASHALKNPTLGALLPEVIVAEPSTSTDLISKAIEHWAPGAWVQSLHIAESSANNFAIATVSGRIYGMCRDNSSEIVLQIQGRAPGTERFNATAYLQLPV
jgi:hypothetical protein